MLLLLVLLLFLEDPGPGGDARDPEAGAPAERAGGPPPGDARRPTITIAITIAITVSIAVAITITTTITITGDARRPDGGHDHRGRRGLELRHGEGADGQQRAPCKDHVLYNMI